MKIGIDIDDTITNTTLLIEQILTDNNLSHISSDFDSHDSNFLKKYDSLIRKNIDNVIKNCPIKENASSVIKYLKAKGYKIYIITARSNDYSPNIYNLTLEYLKKHDIIYDELLFGYDDKVNVCIEKDINIMIDDNIKLINTLKNTKVKGMLFEASYNKKYNEEKVSNWLEVKSYIDNWRN